MGDSRRGQGSPQVASPGDGQSARFAGVYRIVARIPHGRVTTYGAIARALGPPHTGRTVGWAMYAAPAGLPCHRVVNHQGFLSGGWHFGHPDLMAGLLHDENVPFRDRHRVDLRACLWDPDEVETDQTSATARSSPD